LRIPAGSSVRLTSPSRAIERLSHLALVPSAVIAADAVVVGDRATGGEDRLAGRGLGGPPLLDRILELIAGDGEVQRRAGGIDMRDVGQDHRRATEPRQRLAHRARHRRVQGRQDRPEADRLERLDQRPAVQQRIAQVRTPVAVTRPAVAGARHRRGAGGRQAGRGRQLSRRHLVLCALEAHDRQATARRLGRLGRRVELGGLGEPDRRLGLVGEPHDGRGRPVLDQPAQRVGAGGERRQPPTLVQAAPGRRPNRGSDLRDHPQRAFGAEHQLAQIGPGGRPGSPSEVNVPAGVATRRASTSSSKRPYPAEA